MHICRQTIAASGAVNPSLPAVAADITFAYRWCAMAKFFKSRVWDKVPEGSTVIFGDTLISLKHIIA